MNWTYIIDTEIYIEDIKPYIIQRKMWSYPPNMFPNLSLEEVKRLHLLCLDWMLTEKTPYMYDWPGFSVFSGWNVDWRKYIDLPYTTTYGPEFSEPARVLKGGMPCLKASQMCIDEGLPYEMRCWFCPLNIPYINLYMKQFYPDLNENAQFCHGRNSFGKIHMTLRNQEYKGYNIIINEENTLAYFTRYRKCCMDDSAYRELTLTEDILLDFANKSSILQEYKNVFL